MMLDVDHFKSVNDQFGHDVGDKVLIELANILNSVVRDSDIIARYGGEEIAIICPHTERKGAVILAERLCKAVDEQLSISLSNLTVVNGINKENQVHNITVSIGGCCLNDEFQDAFALIKHADKALYRAKDSGRNRVEMAC